MSQQNVDLVLRGARAALKKPKPDYETMNEVFHPDHQFVPTTAKGLGEAEASGAGGWKDFQEAIAAVTPYETEIHGAIDVAPGQVLGVSTNRFRGSSSGLDLEQRLWFLATVADGKIVRTETFSDPAKALEAVGLSE